MPLTAEYEYRKSFRATLPECDIHNRIKLSSIMRHGQQADSEHLDELGFYHERLWKEGVVYLLTKVNIQIHRRPEGGETVTLNTRPRKPKGVQSLRQILLLDAARKELLAAETAWVLVDPIDHRLHRPGDRPHQIPVWPAETANDLAKRRIRRPETVRELNRRTVRYSDLDCNRHTNNAVYADIVCDVLPFELLEKNEISRFEIAFIGEAKLGENLTVVGAELEDGSWYVGADRADGERCFDSTIAFAPKKA